MALVETYSMDNNSILQTEEAEDNRLRDIKLTYDGPQVVAFHFLTHSHDKSNVKWMKLIDQLAHEYAGRILFSLRDISSIGEFNQNLKAEDFGSYRKGISPRIYAKDCQGRVYEMHKLVSYKYMKEFCEQLLHNQLFRAVILGPSPALDSAPRNYFQLLEQMSGDMLGILYDPACYYWTFQQRKLRKLVRLLAGENLPIVVVDKANNYLGVGFTARWLEMVNCHSSIIYSSPSRNGWNIKLEIMMESTRVYLRHIAANRKPELMDYDARGEPRGPKEALEYVQYLF